MLRGTKYFILGIVALIIFVIPVLAATVTVSSDNMNGWVSFSEGTGSNPPPVEFVVGPDTPPMGLGSARFVLNAPADGLALGTGLSNVRLDDFTTLSYSTYVTQNTSVQAVSLQFNVDLDLNDGNTGWQGRLVYEPYYNGTVQTGQWQTWNTLIGRWWLTNSSGSAVCLQSAPCDIATLLSHYPNIGVHADLGAILFKAGSGWAGFDGNVDALVVGINGADTTYDFDLSANQCRNNGWAALGFRNQGQCISAVNSNRGGN